MAKTAKRFPTTNDLLAWYIFYRLDSIPDESPEIILGIINDFMSHSIVGIHTLLQKEYESFREQFKRADDD